ATVTDEVKKKITELDNSPFHKVRIAEIRTDLKNRNAQLAIELGISEKEAEAIINLRAEDLFRQETQGNGLLAGIGSRSDAAAVEELNRLRKAQRQESDD